MGIMCDICKKEIKRDSLDRIKININKKEQRKEEDDSDDIANVPGLKNRINLNFDVCSECYKEKIEKELVK